MRKLSSVKHQPRSVLYDSGVVSRVLDDAFGARVTGFVATHRVVASARRVFINQTVVFELQPVLRVLQNRYPNRADSIEQALTDFNLLELDEQIGEMAISLKRGIEQLKFADATIAATALVYGCDLFTLNQADFAIVPGLRLYKPANYHELLAQIGAAKGEKP